VDVVGRTIPLIDTCRLIDRKTQPRRVLRSMQGCVEQKWKRLPGDIGDLKFYGTRRYADLHDIPFFFPEEATPNGAID